MSGVALRCPTCGTTQMRPGECEACSDDQVRYFCSNHRPGVWLDKPVCAQCGSKFGDSPKREAPPAPRSAPTAPPRTPRRPESPPPPVLRDIAPPRERVRARPPMVPEPEVAPERPSLEDLLEILSPGERERAGYRVEEVTRPEPAPAVKLPSLPIKGCIVRFAILVFLFIALAIGGIFLLVGGGIEGFVVDLGQSTGLMTGTPEQTQRGIDAFRRGDLITAERELAQAAMTYPRSALALLYLAKMRTDAGDLSQAGDYLQTAVQREPDNGSTHRELGLNHLAKATASGRLQSGELVSRDDLVEADRHFVIAGSLAPNDRAAVGYHGCALAELGVEEEAVRVLSLAGDGPWQRCRHVASPRR